MLYTKEDIPSKLLSIENKPIEGFYIEINLTEKNGSFIVHIIYTRIILTTTLILLAKI